MRRRTPRANRKAPLLGAPRTDGFCLSKCVVARQPMFKQVFGVQCSAHPLRLQAAVSFVVVTKRCACFFPKPNPHVMPSFVQRDARHTHSTHTNTNTFTHMLDTQAYLYSYSYWYSYLYLRDRFRQTVFKQVFGVQCLVQLRIQTAFLVLSFAFRCVG